MRRLALLGFAMLWSATASAQNAVSIDGAWCRTSDMRDNVAFVYLTMTLQGDDADSLVAASTPVAGKVEILMPHMVKGREILTSVPAVSLDTHAPTVFQPQDTHIILRDVKQPLKPGDSFPVTLEFQHADKQEAVVRVLDRPPSTGMPDLPAGVKME